MSNTPVTGVGSTAFRCNGRPGVSGKCSVAAGDIVTVEIISNLVIAHAKTKPLVVLTSTLWLFICPKLPTPPLQTAQLDGPRYSKTHGHFVCGRATLDNYGANLWLLQKTGGRVGDDDNWGTKDLDTCCGKTNVKIQSDIAAENYLLRAEALALYTTGKANGAQFYMTCCTSCTPWTTSYIAPF
jgi:cellulase